MGAEVNVGMGREADVGAGVVCGRDVGGAGVSVTEFPHAATPTITAANATSRIEAGNRDIAEV